MAFIYEDRVAETTTTTGTGNITLAGAITGYKALSSVCANNDTFPYSIVAVDGSNVPTGQWETGIGTWTTGGILVRTTVNNSSSSDALVNFSAGTKHVYLSYISSLGVPGSSPPQVDLTSASTDQVLALGQTGFIDCVGVTSRQLFTVCGDNQAFIVSAENNFVSGSAIGAACTLQPNNADTAANAVVNVPIYASQNTPAGGVTNPARFNLSEGNTFLSFRVYISTNKTSKYVKSEWLTRDATIWYGGLTHGVWADSTTSWTSLGTVNFQNSFTGRIYITKVANASAGGGVPGVVAAGSANEIQYRNGGALAAAANTSISTDGHLRLTNVTANPATPPSGSSILHVLDQDAFFSPVLDSLRLEKDDGSERTFQPRMDKVAPFSLYGLNNTILSIGGIGLTITGTATVATEAATNIYTQNRKVEALVTAATTTAVAGYRAQLNTVTVGSPVANVGGFYLDVIGGRATGVATATSRFFMGMASATAAPTDVEPSSITNMFSLACDAADTNMQFMHRGAGAVTKLDLGATLPVGTTDRAELYRLQLYCPPGATQSVKYRVTALSNGNTVTGTVTTNLPSTSTYLGFRMWASVGGTSSVTGIAFVRAYGFINLNI